jgi:hypothetical protein
VTELKKTVVERAGVRMDISANKKKVGRPEIVKT